MVNKEDKNYKRFNSDIKSMDLVYDPAEEINRKNRSYIKDVVNKIFKNQK